MALPDSTWQPYASPSTDDPGGVDPSHVRWRMLGLLMCLVAMSHFNRASIAAFGAEVLIPVYKISEQQFGVTATTYLVIYTLCMLPGGWLIDRVGPRRALIFMGLGTSVLVALTGLVSLAAPVLMLFLLRVLRGLLGAVTATLHPGAARTVSFWLPGPRQAAGNGMVVGAAVAGIAATPFAFGWLMDLVGWQGAFVVAGVVMLLLTGVWWSWASDYPAEHSQVNAAELRLIRGEFAAEPDGIAVATVEVRNAASPQEPLAAKVSDHSPPAVAPTWRALVDLLSNRSLVVLALSFAALGYVQYLFFYWLQYYFGTVIGLDKIQSRLYTTIPTLGMAAGMVGGGWLSGWVERRVGPRGRRLVSAGGLLVCAGMLLPALVIKQPEVVVVCFTLCMAALGCSEPGFWVTGIEMGGSRGGLAAAFLNTMGNAGGLLAPMVTPWFSERYGWDAALGLASVVAFSGAVLWLGVDFNQRLREPQSSLE